MEDYFQKINSAGNSTLIQVAVDEAKDKLGIDCFFEHLSLLNSKAIAAFLNSLSQNEVSQYLDELLKLLSDTRGRSNEENIVAALFKVYSPLIVNEFLHSYRNYTIPIKIRILEYFIANKTEESLGALREIELFERENLPRQLLNKWKSNLQVVIAIAALYDEMSALRERLNHLAGQSQPQEGGEIVLLNSKTNLPYAILKEIGESGNPACRETLEKLLVRYNPSIVILFGIAAAIPRRTKMKDLIVTNKVLDLRKCKIGNPFEFEPKLYVSKKSKYFPFQVADIQKKLRTEFNEEITIHEDCIIGSSDNLSRSVEYVEAASKTHRKLGGIEMEGASVAEICRTNGIPFCIFKALTDYGDPGKSDEVKLLCCKVAASALVSSGLMNP